jgi:hypothetical protein
MTLNEFNELLQSDKDSLATQIIFPREDALFHAPKTLQYDYSAEYPATAYAASWAIKTEDAGYLFVGITGDVAGRYQRLTPGLKMSIDNADVTVFSDIESCHSWNPTK